jgi:GntR family transcriptional regulator
MDIHSMLTLSQTDGRPMYLQIMEQIKLRVAVGDWPPGFKIPSIRELSLSLRVSVITVKRAYMELERENVIVTMQGKGSFIAERSDLGPQLQYQELDKHLEKAVKLAALLGIDAQTLKVRLESVYQQSIKESS